MTRTRSLWIGVLLLMCSRTAPAQDVTGDWQGTLSLGPRQLRLILHVDEADDTTWKATLASIDQSPDWGVGSRHPEKVAGPVYLDAGYSYAFYAPDIDPFPEQPPPNVPTPPVIRAIMSATQQYTNIPVPILAICALPHDPGPAPPAAMRAQETECPGTRDRS